MHLEHVEPEFFRRRLIRSSARDSNGDVKHCATSEGWWNGGPEWFAEQRKQWRHWYKLGSE